MRQASTPSLAGRPRLLDRVRLAIRVRHMSRRTEAAYVGWIRRFIVFHGKRHPKHLGAAEIEQFLGHLATVRGVSPSTQNQARAACFSTVGCSGSTWMTSNTS